MGRASGGVKAQATRRWAYGTSDDLLVSVMRHVALLWLFSMELLTPSRTSSLEKILHSWFDFFRYIVFMTY
jgi:hypothetical protein